MVTLKPVLIHGNHESVLLFHLKQPKLTAGKTYNVSAWVKLSDDNTAVSPGIKLTLQIEHASTEYLELTTVTNVVAGDWVKLSGTYTHSITTEESAALLYVESNELTADFHADDVSVILVEQ